MNKLHFEGTDFNVSWDELSDPLRVALTDCGGSGDALPAVSYVLEQFEITGNEEHCRKYLEGYGAWEDDELQDHTENLRRLVWLSGCNLSQGEDIYFCTY